MSFREKLSPMWRNLKYTLFPELEKVNSELSERHKKLISILELIRIEDFIPCTRFKMGRPQKDRTAIARAIVAKIVFKIPYVKHLLEYLKVDHNLRVICGWIFPEELPSESRFSRAFRDFAKLKISEKAHQYLIKNAYNEQIVEHVIKDSTPLDVREKAIKKESTKKRKAIRNKKRKKKN